MIEDAYNYIDSPTQYVEAKDTLYAYRSLGRRSGYPLVCLQHFTGTLDNWDPLIIDGLARERWVITIDNSGVGNSGGTTPDNVDAMARDAVEVITALGIHKCDILGFSLGGFIAQAIATMRPELLRKIILVGTAPQGTKVLYSFPQLVEKAFQKTPVESFLFLFANGSESSKAKITAAYLRLRERTKDRDKPSIKSAIQAQVNAITRWGTDTVTINLNTIRQPVMIIQGSHDEMMDSASSMELFRHIPDSVLTYYPDSAHGSYFQYPDMFVEQANYFLNNY